MRQGKLAVSCLCEILYPDSEVQSVLADAIHRVTNEKVADEIRRAVIHIDNLIR